MTPESVDAAEKKIVELTKRWNDASLRGDLNVIDSLYSDDCIFQFPNGQSVGKVWVMKLLASGNVAFENIANDDVRIRVFRDAVLWTSRTALIETYNGQRTTGRYLWLRLWACTDDSWQIVAFQSTPVPSAP